MPSFPRATANKYKSLVMYLTRNNLRRDNFTRDNFIAFLNRQKNVSTNGF